MLKAFVILAVFNVTYMTPSTHPSSSFLTFSTAGTLLESYHCTESFLSWNLNSQELTLYPQFLFTLAKYSCLYPDTHLSTLLWLHPFPSPPFVFSLDSTAHHHSHCPARIITHPAPMSCGTGPAHLQRCVNTTMGLSFWSSPRSGQCQRNHTAENGLQIQLVLNNTQKSFSFPHPFLPSFPQKVFQIFITLLQSSAQFFVSPNMTFNCTPKTKNFSSRIWLFEMVPFHGSWHLSPGSSSALSGYLHIVSLPLFYPPPLYLANSCLLIRSCFMYLLWTPPLTLQISVGCLSCRLHQSYGHLIILHGSSAFPVCCTPCDSLWGGFSALCMTG